MSETRYEWSKRIEHETSVCCSERFSLSELRDLCRVMSTRFPPDEPPTAEFFIDWIEGNTVVSGSDQGS